MIGLQRSYITSKSICRILVLLVKCQTGKHQTPKDVFFCLFADDCMVGNENKLLDIERIGM